LDRPFTYLLEGSLEAGIGSLVQVPFHGRAVKGWVLGQADSAPKRMLPVKSVITGVRSFDPAMLELAGWVSRRYVAPLATVLGRLVPPRVVSEELAPSLVPAELAPPFHVEELRGYRGLERMLQGLSRGEGNARFVLRPAPEDEVSAAVAAVGACLSSGRAALVVVPEAEPVPATALALREVFGERVALYLGGSKRARYRMWLDIASGAYDVVVGTRPAVFAPIANLGLLLVSRESHPAHREDRAPYYHVRDVALQRARIANSTCILEALCPSIEAHALGLPVISPAQRRWPPVEVVKPGPEGRAPRLLRALGQARRGFLFSPLPGYGIAAVCRSCGAPAACAACAGMLRSEEGAVICIVCGATGKCSACGASDFGVRPGGAERVEAWAGRVAKVPVKRLGSTDVPRLPVQDEILVGGPDDVRDLGPGGLDLVGVLDADLADKRPGLSARERALSTWMEVVGWARPTGRAVVQASRPNDAAVQSLVAGKPDRFHAEETLRRAAAGFPIGAAVFRVAGSDLLEEQMRRLDPITLLVSFAKGQTICLLALESGKVPEFGRIVRELAATEVVTRVEAEPHL
jgi:primosomal protein N' (replication factor Y)